MMKKNKLLFWAWSLMAIGGVATAWTFVIPGTRLMFLVSSLVLAVGVLLGLWEILSRKDEGE